MESVAGGRTGHDTVSAGDADGYFSEVPGEDPDHRHKILWTNHAETIQ